MRKSLLDVKKALNELPDEELKRFFITHGMALEDPEPKLSVVFYAPEEELEQCHKLFDNPNMKVIREFAEGINDDARKACAASLVEDLMETYCDDTE